MGIWPRIFSRRRSKISRPRLAARTAVLATLRLSTPAAKRAGALLLYSTEKYK